MAARNLLMLLLFIVSFASEVFALFFLIGETERKCFVEEIPDQTMVIGSYKVSMFDPQTKTHTMASSIGMHVEVTDPDSQVVLSRLYASEGKITFTSSKPGEHTICLFSNTSHWISGTMLRVDLNLQVGDHAQDYAEIAVKERLNDLELRIRQLIDQVDQMTKEQNYQRHREEVFRQLSESTNQRVFWWAAAQTAVLMLTGIWQLRHLKGFFEAKKLV
ncbi:EMP24 GP25L domain containing protein [Trichuris trichiura]|uniref:EMP24 GP25L domain containing protein n=1 Tax=Trichuris trichiura TaxID=36087 RepID=A0A077ZE62_TRITR|nr:EMP24 GP25L domain containing protein [Trichuris trichiura]